MKILLLLMSFFVLATFIMCSKQHQAMSNGVIVGWNNGYCITCGGFYLNLSNDTVINTNTYYVLNYSSYLVPVINQLNMQYNKDHKPISVSVAYKFINQTDTGVPPNRIYITDLKKR